MLQGTFRVPVRRQQSGRAILIASLFILGMDCSRVKARQANDRALALWHSEGLLKSLIENATA